MTDWAAFCAKTWGCAGKTCARPHTKRAFPQPVSAPTSGHIAVTTTRESAPPPDQRRPPLIWGDVARTTGADTLLAGERTRLSAGVKRTPTSRPLISVRPPKVSFGVGG